MIDRIDVVLSMRDAAALSTILAASRLHSDANGATDDLADVLSNAQIVTDHALPREVVALDTEVTYVELPGGQRRTVRLVHPAQAEPSAARISVFAPVGRALLGRRAGSRVPVALPDGAIDALHVIAIKRAGGRDDA